MCECRNRHVLDKRVNNKNRNINQIQNNKQLLDEAEHNIKNCPDQGQCYLPKPKAEANNIDRGLDNS